MHIRLYNDAPHPLTDFKLCFSLNTPIDATALTHATVVTQSGSYLELVSPASSLNAYSGWEFIISQLKIPCFHASDAPARPFVVISRHTQDHILMVYTHPPRCLTPHYIASSYQEPEEPRQDVLPLIPYPSSIKRLSGYHTAKKYYIDTTTPQELRSVLHTLCEYTKDLGLEPCIHSAPSSMHSDTTEEYASISILMTEEIPHAEAYSLTIARNNISIKIRSVSGLRHAYMTFLQLHAHTTRMPCVSIYDEPRFSWRGMMLDTVRQYYTPKEIKRIIRLLALHKMNTFHWHMTDDEAWRIELDAFPHLTDEYAYRGYFQKQYPYFGSGPHKNGSIYSKQDIKDIVAYAQSLGIEIVPEFDIPGHSLALIQGIEALKEKEDTSKYMSVQGYRHNVLNPGLEYTYTVITAIIKEICELFPGKYFHFGCDEVAEHAWTDSPACKKIMHQHNLTHVSQLQSLFARNILHIIQQHGKISASWEEAAMYGDIDKTNVVFSWKGIQEGIRATERGYNIVMCPGQYYYLDMAQSTYPDDVGASWAGVSHVHDTYAFEPVSADIQHGERVLGVQANLWSENLWMKSRVDYMIFPRLAAVAETAWTSRQHKDYHRFISIVKHEYYALLRAMGVGYYTL